MPWPPPTHIVSRPKVLSRSRRPLSRVHRMRAPVMPNGWPSAIAPPCGFSFSLKGSTPMPRADGMTWAAKASLISTMSTSSMLIPARLSACFEASIGPRPMNSGSSADRPVATTRASGLIPSSLALDRVTILLFATELLAGGNVFRRLAHRDVDVGIFLGVAGHQPGVVRVGCVRIAAAIARDALNPDREERVALAGLDRMGRHACGHKR